MTKLKGKVALVVGAGSPLGSAAAQALASEGAWVGALDWSPNAAEKSLAAVVADGGEGRAYQADASKKLAFQTALEAMLEERAKIDILLNASTVQPKGTLLELDEWDWRRALDLNLSSVFLSMQSVGRVMRDLGGGMMINLLAAPSESTTAPYQTAAAGIEALTQNAAKELAEHNIQVHLLQATDSVEALHDLLMPLFDQKTGGES